MHPPPFHHLAFSHHTFLTTIARYVADDDVKAPEKAPRNPLHIVNGKQFRSVKQSGPGGVDSTSNRPPPSMPYHGDELYGVESTYSTRDSTVMRIDYPYELFWRMVYNKVDRKDGGGRSSYDGSTPNFKKFGSLPMLVPIYEAVLAGYNVIYFDVDTALVLDPIPYISKGDADFVFGIESRKPCREVSQTSRVDHEDWRQVEPNTGTMMVRSTNQSKALFTQWLEEMIDGNFNNDQKVFSGRFRYLQQMTYTPNCLSHTHPSIGAVSTPSRRSSPQSSTYCFLSDVLFANGFISLRCAHADGWNWMRQLHEQGIRVESSTTPVYYPAVIHVNYCNHKSRELVNKGLWLMVAPEGDNITSTQMSCARYGGAGSTYYGDNRQYNITLEMHKFGIELDIMYSGLLKSGPGTTMRERYGTIVYVIGADGRLSSFPDQRTFDAMNYTNDKVPLTSVPSLLHCYDGGNDRDDDEEEQYTNLSIISASCSFYSYTPHFPSLSPSPSFTISLYPYCNHHPYRCIVCTRTLFEGSISTVSCHL